MKQIEKHPAPEKLLQQITEAAINALALGGPDKIGDEAPMEAGVKLIAKAWGLPQESQQASLELIERERQLLRSGSSEDALPNSALLKPYDGKMITELLWGLFETTVKLEDAQDRVAMHKLALLMAESLNLDSLDRRVRAIQALRRKHTGGGCPWTAPSTLRKEGSFASAEVERPPCPRAKLTTGGSATSNRK